MFEIFKLDFVDNDQWVDVKSLGDRVLFLGGNHSMSVSTNDFPECKRNSIYFTDHYWERMNEDYSHGGMIYVFLVLIIKA